MKIEIASGTGAAPTQLAAFDAALLDAGVANYNLIPLSSIIPPNTELVEADKAHPTGEWGDRLYVVIAQQRTAIHNMEAWAGIGWVQQKSTGKGIFVEHYGGNEEQVRRDIKDSLKSITASRNEDFGPIKMKVSGAKCHTKPVCALVIAVYEPDGWRSG